MFLEHTLIKVHIIFVFVTMCISSSLALLMFTGFDEVLLKRSSRLYVELKTKLI